MVRHPKKKEDEKSNGNDTAKDNPVESPPSITDESRRKSGLDKLFWLRVGLGVLAGSLSALIGSSQSIESSRMVLGFGIMIILFIVSYVLAKSMKIPIIPSDKKKLITTGYGSYFLMFIFCWILVNTLIHPDVGILTVR
ncbi:hypothetical protein [Candidatus Nitrosotalea okcheonensis]|uniref:Uncharacterized protein n=1 Tax=Candidatus Nitrosotalea okcheonensis TaxID=1903276 RepID=A0A2H1FHC7_9ARCH|nr:hypothetical protein [Candidatus Nitrosotalea okcheonensis]MDE1728640.1 hypothetical protein [Nitrososphaerota archaeon]MDE1831545.1 hypothetical protein [Nitrososphaerota archaeon]MDE1841251.1 hypothetical protein [Nitrososphaerota archaeon]MDE1877636.1 hypothetical protein [Nitrososphaerota archaeon]SMH72144.1 conserved membrane protein of unknown function [Candidatus Nitrosotalea okcheonensis]